MTNFKNYTDTIKAAVAEERNRDEYWSWSIKAINKSNVKIDWEYLKGEKNSDFTVEIKGEDEDPWVEGILPNGSKVIAIIGDDRWSDGDIAECITKVIHGMGTKARSIY